MMPRIRRSDTEDTEPTSDPGGYGFPAPLWRMLDEHPPPGVRRAQRWRSPLRGRWLTSVFGSVLLATLPIVIITGLLSYIAYGPRFGQAIPGDVGWLKLPTFDWPTNPAWLYRLTQGLHVGLGLVLIPVVLAKLWSVIPRLFAWPPARSIAQLLERISLLMLVGGILFEIVTGVLNIQYDYIFGFSFYTAHYFGAWVFIAGFVVHIAIKIPTMWSGLRSISPRDVLRTGRADTTAEPWEPDGLVAADPHPATMSRRGALALVGGGALFMAVITAGQTLGGYTRPAALLLPRGRTRGDGPNDFEINRTAVVAGIIRRKHRRALAAHRERRSPSGGPGPRRAAGHAAAHRRAADRLRGRLVHHPGLDGGAAGGPGPAGRRSRTGVGGRFVIGAIRRVRPRDSAGEPGAAPGRPAGTARQRRRPVPGSRLPGAHHRAGAARGAQHQVGGVDRLPCGRKCVARERFS